MNANQLAAFAAVCDEGSIRAGARALNLSASSITRSLHELEEEALTQLFRRTTSGVTVTERGQPLLVYAQRVGAGMKLAKEEIRLMRGESQKRIAVAVTPWITMTVLPAAVSRFRRCMPDVTVEFVEGLRAVANPLLRQERLDFFVGWDEQDGSNPDLTFRPILRTGAAITVRKGHPLRACQSLAELLDLEWLIPIDPPSQGGIMYRLFEKYNLPFPARVHPIHSFTYALGLIPETDMAGVFPWPLIEASAMRNLLCAVPLREQMDDHVYGVISPAGYPLGAPARQFAECLIEALHAAVSSSDPEIRRVMSSVEMLV
ncbi:LysR substrate-binding domain-containing protein [Paraburkholderia youngii]|uniref:LysR substrate-binding domain-containing protein n=1 Tax=Paraburkholderia youngii TaxID=2782701 RepID=UPI00158FBAA4|nr:LysR substrate-binding domain-containing protein [Paraburkholderia youngii]NUX55952.1 LysR family transcriptional regulator [Paraburkholderia youngii]